MSFHERLLASLSRAPSSAATSHCELSAGIHHRVISSPLCSLIIFRQLIMHQRRTAYIYAYVVANMGRVGEKSGRDRPPGTAWRYYIVISSARLT